MYMYNYIEINIIETLVSWVTALLAWYFRIFHGCNTVVRNSIKIKKTLVELLHYYCLYNKISAQNVMTHINSEYLDYVTQLYNDCGLNR